MKTIKHIVLGLSLDFCLGLVSYYWVVALDIDRTFLSRNTCVMGFVDLFLYLF